VQELAVREPRTTLLTITPGIARAWPARKISPAEPDQRTAKRHAEQMRAGLWRSRDEEPIELKVADDGSACVIDGQHRLAAVVVIANQPVALMVRFL
jgi:hypothetical protein